MFKHSSQRGITLFELLIALCISTFVILGMLEIYMSSQSNKQAQLAVNTLQENGRVATQLLSSQIRIAGLLGCAKLTPNFPLINHSTIPIRANNKIQNYFDDEMKANTTAMTLWHASQKYTLLSRDMKMKNILWIPADFSVSPQTVLIITDCKTTEVVPVKQVVTEEGLQKIETTVPLQKLFGQASEVSVLERASYFVGNTGRVSSDGEPIDALYMRGLDDRKTELVEGVQDMQISYVQAEDHQLISHPINDVMGENLRAMQIRLTLTSTNHFKLTKQWNIYVALRE